MERDPSETQVHSRAKSWEWNKNFEKRTFEKSFPAPQSLLYTPEMEEFEASSALKIIIATTKPNPSSALA